MTALTSARLHRYWLRTEVGFGVGVTAYSIDDAKQLAKAWLDFWQRDVVEIVEDVDIRNLDQDHVIPNMGPPNVRGVWFPFQNLSRR